MAQRDARPPFAAIDGAVPLEFSALPTPCYLLDEAALTHNAEILGGLARRTGCKVLLAQKAFSNYDLYPLLAPHLAGTEASGLFEARLGAEEMPGKEVHVFCAAYRADEMDELLRYADHIVFNSPAQLAKFGPVAKAAGKSVGLRINPECSTQDGHAIYDPCAPGSRLGTTRAQWDAAAAENSALPGLLDGLHFHTLCEQDADALAVTLDAVAKKFGDLLPKMKWLNFGGGHHITRPGYDMAALEKCIRRARNDWGVTVYLEPGEKPCTVRLAGPTCLAGDVIGDYSFDAVPAVGDLLVFGDMAIYTTCKNNTFNGMPLPGIYARKPDGTTRKIVTFGYTDFKCRLGK